MRLWTGAARALEQTIYYLSAVLLIALTAVIGYVVLMRYAFNSAPGWSEEVPRVIFLWMSYLAIGVAIQRGQNLRVTVVIERFAPGPRLALELAMHAAVFVMLAYLIGFNMPVLELTAGTKLLATGWPDSILHWPLTVGCVLMALFQIRQVMRSIDEYRAATAARARA